MTAGNPWKVATGVLGVLLAVMLAVLGVKVFGDDPASTPQSQALFDAEKQANEAARSAAVSLTSYDYTSLEADFGWAKDGATKKFQDQYAEVSAPIRELVLKLKAHAEGSVVDSAAHAVDPDHVTVLLFVDQTLTNKSSAERKLDQPRMTMNMVRQDGRWLVDEVKLSNLSTS